MAMQNYDKYVSVEDRDQDNAYNKLLLARQKQYTYAALMAEMCRYWNITFIVGVWEHP